MNDGSWVFCALPTAECKPINNTKVKETIYEMNSTGTLHVRYQREIVMLYDSPNSFHYEFTRLGGGLRKEEETRAARLKSLCNMTLFLSIAHGLYSISFSFPRTD